MRDTFHYAFLSCYKTIREYLHKGINTIFGTQKLVKGKPVRPHVSIILLSSLLLWAGTSLSYAYSQDLNEEYSIVLISLCGLCCLIVIFLIVIKKLQHKIVVLLCIIALCLGGMLGTSQALSNHMLRSIIDQDFIDSCELSLIEDASEGLLGREASVRATLANGVESIFLARFPNDYHALCNERYKAQISIHPFSASMQTRGWNEGQIAVIEIKNCEKIDAGFPLTQLSQIRKTILDAFIPLENDPSYLFQAIVCGYRNNIKNTDLYSSFQQCGLAHLIAVSGAHLMIVAGMVLVLCRQLQVSRRITILIMIVFMFSYYIVAGMPISALRAMLMTSAGLFSFLAKRRPHALNAVGLSLIIILLQNPSSALSVSLLLSALATLGIVLFSPLINYWFKQIPVLRISLIGEPLSLTLSALLLTQLCSASLFHQLSLIAPLANIVAAPLFSIVCCVGLLGGVAVCLFPYLLGFMHALIRFVYAWVIDIIEAISRIPYAAVPISIDFYFSLALTLVAVICLLAWWPTRKPHSFSYIYLLPPVATLAAVLAILSFSPYGNDRIVMLDVGQGDSFLIQSKGESLLIDTGNKDSLLLQGLAQNKVAHLDGVLITHADDDHCGSLDALRKVVEVDTIYLARGIMDDDSASTTALMREAKKSAREVKEVSVGDSIDIGAFQGRVVWPNHVQEHGGNSDSLVVLVEYDGDTDSRIDYRILMTGDAEKNELKSIVDNGLVGDIDILKIGHHGSKNGIYEPTLDKLSPEVAFISCGLHNRYGHPAKSIIELLENRNIDIYRTDTNGEVVCNFNPRSLQLATQK